MDGLLKNSLVILVALISFKKLSEARANADIRRDDEDNDDASNYEAVHSANHNESCSPSKFCKMDANMECSSADGNGRCQCISGWIYAQATRTCSKIIVSRVEDCIHDIQCQAGRWGHLSRCSKQTAKCECFDQDSSGSKRETVLSEDGICFIKMSVGDMCDTHEECDQSILGEAYCQHNQNDSSPGKTYNGICQCKDTSSWYNPSGKCLLKATQLGDECEVSDQCSNGTLGALSTCDSNTQKCVCMNSSEPNIEVIYYEKLKKCFIKKEYNDTCTEDDECRANLGPDVKCGPTEYLEEKVCHCPKGRICRSIEWSKSFSLNLIAGLIVVVIVIEAVCVGIFCCIRSKRLRRKLAVVRAAYSTTTASNGQTDTDTAQRSARFTTAHISGPAPVIPNSNSAGRRLYPVQENVSAAVPLLQIQQRVKYPHAPQPMRFGHTVTSNRQPQNYPQSLR